MLDKARIGIAQWLAAPGKPADNLATALDLIEGLGRDRCDLIVLPELWPSGYNWATLADDVRAAAEPLTGERIAVLGEAARTARAWVAAGSVPELADDSVFNTAVLFSPDGQLCAFHRKAHLYEPMHEQGAVGRGEALTVCETDAFGTVGLTICFDGDFPEVARTMATAGARVVIQPSAYEVEAEAWWDRLYPAHALENGQWWIMANQCGVTPSGRLLGGSQVVSPSGEIVARAPKVGESDDPGRPRTLVVDVDLHAELQRAEQESAVLWRLRRPELYRPSSVVRFTLDSERSRIENRAAAPAAPVGKRSLSDGSPGAA